MAVRTPRVLEACSISAWTAKYDIAQITGVVELKHQVSEVLLQGVRD
jgi:hypothetical protein